MLPNRKMGTEFVSDAKHYPFRQRGSRGAPRGIEHKPAVAASCTVGPVCVGEGLPEPVACRDGNQSAGGVIALNVFRVCHPELPTNPPRIRVRDLDEAVRDIRVARPDSRL